MHATTVLGVFAHPDDESMGPGGTLAKLTRDGARVTLAILTRGERGESPGMAPLVNLGMVRTEEMQRAAKILGVADLCPFDFPDGGLEAHAEDIHRVIDQLVDELRPDVLLTFHELGITGHADHAAVSRAVTEVWRARARRDPLLAPSLYYWGLPQSVAERLTQDFGVVLLGIPDQAVDTIVDVDSFRPIQWEAIMAHRSQIPPEPVLLRTRLRLMAGRETFLRAAPSHGWPEPALDDENDPGAPVVVVRARGTGEAG